MNAKDTVATYWPEYTNEILKKWVEQPSPELNSLIRISFKVAIKEVIKEVTPLIGRYKNCDYVCGEPEIPCDFRSRCQYAKWQSKLREWQ